MPSQIPDEFWESEQRTLLAVLRPRLEQMAYQAMIDAGRKAGIAFDARLYSVEAETWARTYTDLILGELGTTSKTVVGNVLADWIARPEATMGDLNSALTPVFGRKRANVIAVTEATRAFSSGEEIVYRQAGIESWTWMTNRDELVCRFCGAVHGKTVRIGQPFGMFRGKLVTKPPYHPNCRCWVRPVVMRRVWAMPAPPGIKTGGIMPIIDAGDRNQPE